MGKPIEDSHVNEVHICKFNIPKELKVPLLRYETIDGVRISTNVGFDIVKVWACKCEKTRAYDLERRTI